MAISLKELNEAMNSVLQQFLAGNEEHSTFRSCGKEFRQDEDFGIHVTAKDNTERAQPITYDAKYGLTRKATVDEIHQLRSVTQSLAWIIIQTSLTFHTAFRRFKAFSNMLVFETCVSAIALWSTLHPHPHVASVFLQFFFG